MNGQPFGLLELGSNSLKFYRVERPSGATYRIHTHKIPWRIAHDFFSRGALGEEMAEHLIAVLRQVEGLAGGLPLKGMLCLATGVFRELPEIDALAARVKKETGVRLRVISGTDEAHLMARNFTATSDGSVVLGDVGGATTEWAWIAKGRPRGCGSLRLGAIRNRYLLRGLEGDVAGYLTRSRELCDEALATLPLTVESLLLVTGGTAKALARSSRKDVLRLDEVQAVVEDVLRGRAPEDLSPERQEVFLPGLIILERLMVRCRAPTLRYSDKSVREGMASRLVHLLDKRGPADLHSTLLLNTPGP